MLPGFNEVEVAALEAFGAPGGVLPWSSRTPQAVKALEAQFLPLLRNKDQRIALAAATRAVWKELARYEAET